MPSHPDEAEAPADEDPWSRLGTGPSVSTRSAALSGIALAPDTENQPAVPSLSWSQISTLQTCGEKYRLERVLRAPRTPAWWSIGGSLVHEITEHMDRVRLDSGHLLSDEDVRTVTRERMASLIAESDELEPDRSRWPSAGSVKDPQTEVWWTEQARLQANGWQDWLLASEMGIAEFREPAIELDMRFEVALGVWFRAIADRVLVSHGSMLVVDLKSGSKTPITPFQLATQAMMVEHTTGVPVHWGSFFMTRKGVLTPPMDLRPAKAKAVDLILAARDTIDRGNFMPQVTELCRVCDVRRFCSIQGGDPSLIPETPK